MPQGVRKEIAVSVLTVFGVLTTVGVGYLLRHVPAIRDLAVTAEPHIVGLVIYGLAISLVASAARNIRIRDTIILILAATIVWAIFVEAKQISGMVRFLLFCSVATAAVLVARRVFGVAGGWLRVVGGTLVPAIACCLAGLVYYGLARGAGGGPSGAAGMGKDLQAGAVWGFSLGMAVGLGLSVGGEVLRWMSREDS